MTPQIVVARPFERIRVLAEKAEAEQKVLVLGPDSVLLLIETLDPPAPALNLLGGVAPPWSPAQF
jgi:hypothetical protein